MRPQANYFGAGPALLPSEVVEAAAADFIDYKNLGIGVGEISHRSGDAIAIINATKEKITKLLDIPDTHEVFFCQGGGTGGFAAVTYNMLAAYAAKTGKKGKANYFVTGSWSQKACEEAKRLGADVHVVADAKKQNGKYGSIPAQSTWQFSDDAAYVYYCDNETVHGVEFPEIPKVPEGVELVADMSSNFLSRKVDVSKFGLLFGGAQKNIGIAGVSLYIIKKSLLERPEDDKLRELGIPLCPIFLDFPSVVKNNSAYNTISILAVQVMNLYMDHLIAKGGLGAQEAEANSKAQKVYAVVDKYPQVYTKLVDEKARSRMNIVFTTTDDDKFVKGAAERNLTGLKGHRSVGGIRVSNYNAVTENSIDLLVKYMEEFANSQ
uniref:phosphoserine transaminase n=1 Tax=Blastobotrys adeninivorans TaxID=409370 RepID=A0A060TBZ2_BLAAD